MNARDELALELFIGDNANQPRESSLQDWAWFEETGRQRGQVEHYKAMATAVLEAGYTKSPDAAHIEAMERLRYIREWADAMIEDSYYPQYGRDVKTLLDTPIEELRAV